MHTPVGWGVNEVGQFVPAGRRIDIIFNPSFPYRLVYTVTAAYLTTALVVGGVGPWHLLKKRDTPASVPCSAWRCGWRRSSRPFRISSATSTASTRWNISPPIVPIVFALIVGLLFEALGGVMASLAVYAAVSLGIAGGAFGLALASLPFSISPAVGFIVLLGVTVLNGLIFMTSVK